MDLFGFLLYVHVPYTDYFFEGHHKDVPISQKWQLGTFASSQHECKTYTCVDSKYKNKRALNSDTGKDVLNV